MFVGFGISRPVQWKPGVLSGKWGWRGYWLWFEIAFMRDELIIAMLKFHVEQIKEEMGDGYVTYYRLNPHGNRDEMKTLNWRERADKS